MKIGEGTRQIDLVYKAVAEGCDTSRQVSERTGLTVALCAAALGELSRCGVIIRCGTMINATGQHVNLWDVCCD